MKARLLKMLTRGIINPAEARTLALQEGITITDAEITEATPPENRDQRVLVQFGSKASPRTVMQLVVRLNIQFPEYPTWVTYRDNEFVITSALPREIVETLKLDVYPETTVPLDT